MRGDEGAQKITHNKNIEVGRRMVREERLRRWEGAGSTTDGGDGQPADRV